MKKLLQILILGAALPLFGLAFAALLGVALTRGTSPLTGGLMALALLTLPTVGISALGNHRLLAMVIAVFGWPLLMLVNLPHYFPGERWPAVQSGIAFMGQSIPNFQPYAEPLEEKADRIISQLGEDPTPLPLAPIIEEATPRPVKEVDPAAPHSTLTFEGDGRRMLVNVQFEGPKGRLDTPMLFDTGASITTLDSKTLAQLGVDIPRNGPTLTLHTANGKRSCPVAFLNGVTLAGELVDGISVAVCDDCGGVAKGLLGLNVTGLFQVAISHESQELQLKRRGEYVDRLIDIQPWLEVNSKAMRRGFGPIEVEVEVENKAPQMVSRADVEVACQNRSFSIEVNDIPPGQRQKTAVALPSDSICQKYTVGFVGAYW